MSVDLPEPEGPMMATYSPRSIRRLTPRNACTCSVPIWYVFQRSSVQMMQSLGGAMIVSEISATCVAILFSWSAATREPHSLYFVRRKKGAGVYDSDLFARELSTFTPAPLRRVLSTL